VLFTHVANNLSTAWGFAGGTGLVSVEYTFHGESAHSAGAPWRGRSALDAVQLMTLGWELRREHLRPEQRSHFVIRDGGDQPNVVPPRASVWFFYREQTFDDIGKNYNIGNKIAEAAAQMTDTTLTRRMLGTAAPQNFNRPLAEAAYKNIKVVGLPQWTEDEQKFAKALQKNIGAKEEGLATQLDALAEPPKEPRSGGSDDIGDVSWNVPTITVRYPSNIPNLPGHNWANAVAMATPIAHKGNIAGSKVIAMTTLDLLSDKKLLPQVKEYFTAVTTQDQKYVAFLSATDRPAVEFNGETMTQYKAGLQKYYYDPSRYATYLEQLGIPFPVLEKPATAKRAD
jgi:aminobenzoyl-glutamate utilization protein B